MKAGSRSAQVSQFIQSKENYEITTNIRRGLIIVITGDGKGKSTAAFGTLLRAWGRGLRVCVIQFIKAETDKWGEVRAAENLELSGTPAATALPGVQKMKTKQSPAPATVGNLRKK